MICLRECVGTAQLCQVWLLLPLLLLSFTPSGHGQQDSIPDIPVISKVLITTPGPKLITTTLPQVKGPATARVTIPTKPTTPGITLKDVSRPSTFRPTIAMGTTRFNPIIANNNASRPSTIGPSRAATPPISTTPVINVSSAPDSLRGSLCTVYIMTSLLVLLHHFVLQ